MIKFAAIVKGLSTRENVTGHGNHGHGKILLMKLYIIYSQKFKLITKISTQEIDQIRQGI